MRMQTKRVERTERKKKEQEDKKEHDWNINVVFYRDLTRSEIEKLKVKKYVHYGKYIKIATQSFEFTVKAKGATFPLPLSVPIDKEKDIDLFRLGTEVILITSEEYMELLQSLFNYLFDAFVVECVFLCCCHFLVCCMLLLFCC